MKFIILILVLDFFNQHTTLLPESGQNTYKRNVNLHRRL